MADPDEEWERALAAEGGWAGRRTGRPRLWPQSRAAATTTRWSASWAELDASMPPPATRLPLTPSVPRRPSGLRLTQRQAPAHGATNVAAGRGS